MGLDPSGTLGMVASSVTPAVLAFLLAAPGDAGRGSPQARRWDEALAAARAEPDPLRRARETVEVLYGAGDLPGALAEARQGLGAGPDDLPLLRRACEIAIALRLAEPARQHVERLEASLPRQRLDPEAARWWEDELSTLRSRTDTLTDREASVREAVLRSRWISLGTLGALLLGIGAVARRPAASGGDGAPPASG